MENWYVKPDYSLEWMIMTRAQMVAFLNWTVHPCKVKQYQAWSWGDSGVEE